MTPEQLLWQAVLVRAVWDATAEDPQHQADIKAKREADIWLRGGQDFRQVCMMAGMDPDFIKDAYAAGRIDGKLLRASEFQRAAS